MVASETQVETPTLYFHRAGVCLHLVDVPTNSKAGTPKCPQLVPLSSPELRSFELDLLSHTYSHKAPFATVRTPMQSLSVTMHFPAELAYTSEGSEIRLLCHEPLRRVRVLPSYTQFHSGIRVYHIALIPDVSFSEYDLIKLIKLYGGQEEGVTLTDKVAFSLEEGRQIPLMELVGKAFEKESVGKMPLVAATVEVVTENAESLSFNWQVLWDIINLIPTNKKQAIVEIDKLLRQQDSSGKVVKALSGIVQGIFNFEKTDAAELVDVLEPTVGETAGLMRMHKGTLLYLCQEDRAFEACYHTLGVSPYLLTPHAVLLHNEAVTSKGEELLNEAQSKKSLGKQENLYAEAEHRLNGELLPNVFHYSTERLLFERGFISRGLSDRLNAKLRQSQAVATRIEARQQQKQRRSDCLIQLFLGILSSWAAGEVVFKLLDTTTVWRWLLAGTVVAVAVAAIIVVHLVAQRR